MRTDQIPLLVFTAPIISFVAWFAIPSLIRAGAGLFNEIIRFNKYAHIIVFSSPFIVSLVYLELANISPGLWFWYIYGFFGMLLLATVGRCAAYIHNDSALMNAMYGIVIGLVVAVALVHVSPAPNGAKTNPAKVMENLMLILGGGLAGNMLHSSLADVQIRGRMKQAANLASSSTT